ncbi:8765_t:CDS:2 [Racocetra fulgida]|uniref:8765_t:CDS:1 n=1 Tax=Racocetra fulgida TaxID=60492 RepID=A0A9N8WI31_9GLOM|nr:8765_t:CDS:2 [Racocetra fulgida]
MSFGANFECLTNPEEKSQFVTNFEYAQNVMFKRFEHPLWKITEKFSEKGRRMREACKYIDDYIYNMINNYKSKLEIEKKTASNLLALLINAVDENGKKFNDRELRDVVLNLIIADNVLPNNTPVFAGEYVEYNLFAMGRDEKIWGEDAKQFNPQRFLDSEDGLRPNKFNLGQQFATLEVIMLVVMMFREFKFELVPGQKLPPEFEDSIT